MTGIFNEPGEDIDALASSADLLDLSRATIAAHLTTPHRGATT